MENNLFKEYRDRKGISLKQISDSIRGLSYKRICMLDEDPRNNKLKAHEFMIITHMLELNNEETEKLLYWFCGR